MPPNLVRSAPTGVRIAPPEAHGPVPGSAAALERLRLGLYTACLAIALALDIAVHGEALGPAFWGCGCGVMLFLIAAYLVRGVVFRIAVLTGLVFALAVPLGPALARGLPLLSMPLWPQSLVALFASRVLSEDCGHRFAQLWRVPLRQVEPAAAQSAGAAVALGVVLTLLFYQGIVWLDPKPSGELGFASIVTMALTGETPVHRTIIALFFVILAYLGESALIHVQDRMALGALQRAASEGNMPREGRTAGILADPAATLGEIRAALLLEAARERIEGSRPAALLLRSAAFGMFLSGSRRFVRGLLPVLPMLGFFGTVVGLATAMAALPTSAPEGGAVDISGSLSGLAIKFQTTLLGLMASLIASVLLALIEKSEAELGAAFALFAAGMEENADGV